MASMTIRNLEDRVKVRLRIRAAEHGRSMEEEAREILANALAAEPARPGNLFDSIRRRFEAAGFVDLPEIKRGPMRFPVEFD
jgi:plasmid stability protein